MKVKILLLDLGTSRLIVEGFGNMVNFELFVLSEPIPSTDTFITPSTAPVETVVTSGFAPGWSGEIRYSKTQDGNTDVIVFLTKNTDVTSNETLYPVLPVKPKTTILQFVNFQNAGGSGINGSTCNAYITSAGATGFAISSGTSLVGARKVQFAFSFTA